MRTHDFKLRCDKPKDDDAQLQVAHKDLTQDENTGDPDAAEICDAEPEDLAEEAIGYLAENKDHTVEFDGGRVWFESDGDRWVMFESDEIATEPTVFKTREELKAALVKAINAETEGHDDWEWCGWCHDLFPTSEMVREKNLGWLCNRCAAAIRSRGEKLTVEDVTAADGKKNIRKYETAAQYLSAGYKEVPVTFNLAEAFDEKTLNNLLDRVRDYKHTNVSGGVEGEELEFAQRVVKDLPKYNKNSAWYREQTEEAARRGYRPLDDLVNYVKTKIGTAVASTAFDPKTKMPLDVGFTSSVFAKYKPDGTLDIQRGFDKFTDPEKEKAVQSLKDPTGAEYATKGQLENVMGDELFVRYPDRFKKAAEEALGPKPGPVKKQETKYASPESLAERYGEGDPSKINLMLRYFRNEEMRPEDKAKAEEIVAEKNKATDKARDIVKKAREKYESELLPKIIRQFGLDRLPGWRDWPSYKDFANYQIYGILRDNEMMERYRAGMEQFKEDVKNGIRAVLEEVARLKEKHTDFLEGL